MDDSKDAFTPQINYELLVEEALRSVVRSSLRIAQENGLPGETHFFITFLTTYPGVVIPERLRQSHPEKMTIIIQHQFWDLKSDIHDFSVTLSFGGKRENLTIPFMAVIDFNDPSVGFGLQFSHDNLAENDSDEGAELAEESPPSPAEKPTEKHGGKPGQKHGEKRNDGAHQGADVVSLDTFRKKT